jgi:hypothetical protein
MTWIARCASLLVLLGVLVGCGVQDVGPDARHEPADGSASDVSSTDAPVDPAVCARFDDVPERLTAGATIADAPELAPDVSALATSTSGGFLAVRTTRMHTTLMVVALEASSLELTNALSVAVGDAGVLSCSGRMTRQIEHHSHTPSTFYVRVPAGETRILFTTD